jgi:hypothetical protein
MANLGVFDWLREGVRRSILLGVSDAFEQIGTTDATAELHPQLAGVLRSTAPRVLEAAGEPAPQRSISKTERRRLGRSLDQIRSTANKLENSAS